MSLQTANHEPHGSPCSSLGSSLSKKRSREDAGFTEFTTPPPSRRCSREADDRSCSRLPTPYYTPPASDSGSPSVKSEAFQGPLPRIDIDDSLCIRLKGQVGQDSSSAIKLPSLQEFDQGVQALADTKVQPPSSPATQSLPSFQTVFNPQLPALQSYAPQESSPAQTYYSAPSPSYQTAPGSWMSPGFVSVNHTPRTTLTTPYPAFPTPDLPPEELYPHAQPKERNKHCNKKYSVEEGDFVIYLWHDKKLKWEQVRDEFARVFGAEPMRTTQGLQAWYYRMNGVIPCWDKDGYLIFDSDEILEPRTRTIKVRDKDKSEVSSEPLGLAQRYPERGMAYPWVEHKDKIAMRDWAAKRIQQFNQRRERRRQKEERRATEIQEANAPRSLQQTPLAVAPLGYRSHL